MPDEERIGIRLSEVVTMLSYARQLERYLAGGEPLHRHHAATIRTFLEYEMTAHGHRVTPIRDMARGEGHMPD